MVSGREDFSVELRAGFSRIKNKHQKLHDLFPICKAESKKGHINLKDTQGRHLGVVLSVELRAGFSRIKNKHQKLPDFFPICKAESKKGHINLKDTQGRHLGGGGQMPTPDFPEGPSFHQKGSFAGHNNNTICY